MPVTVTVLADKVIDYVHTALDHPTWFVKRVYVMYSDRIKGVCYKDLENDNGDVIQLIDTYEVAPLAVRVTAYDKTSRKDVTHTISYEDLSAILDPVSRSIPYIFVRNTNNKRKYFPSGYTRLDIVTDKKQAYNGHPFYNHSTVPMKATKALNTLNSHVLELIRERQTVVRNQWVDKYIDDWFNDNWDDDKPDINSMNYGYDVEGGYKD